MSEKEEVTPKLPKYLIDKGFCLKQKVGGGGFSNVYSAKWDKMPDKELAVKIIDLSHVDKNWIEKNLKLEMKIIRVLRHKNVVKVYELSKTLTNAYIFMDLAKNGSIEDYIQKIKKPMTESKAKKWFRDVISGLSYIHSRGIAHRDIKPENFLIGENDSAMLTDFGFACIDQTGSHEKLMRGTVLGTTNFKAPEIEYLLNGKAYDAKATDIYSMGVSLFYMINYDFPYDRNDNRKRIKQNNRNYKHTNEKNLTKDVIDLIYRMLDPNPNTRVTAIAVEKDKWFKK